MKGFKKRAPLALWKVILIVIAGLIGLAGATALVLFLTGRLSDKVVDPEDMAFMRSVDGQGYSDDMDGNLCFFLSDDSELTISCTTEGVTETKVTLGLRNGVTRNGKITDGVITVPNEVELNKPFKVELVRRNNMVVGSVDGYSYISAKSQNILLPTRNAIIAVDTPVSEIKLAVGGGEVALENEMQNVVVGSTFNINAIFTPENSKYLFNNKNTSKKVFYQVLGSDSVNYITYTENEDGSYTFYADEVSGNKYSIVNAYAFSNSYFEKRYFDEHPNATTDEIIAFLQNEDNAVMAVSQSINIKVLDIEVDDVIVEPSAELAEVYVDKYFTLSTNSTERPNDMSLGIQIFDSGKKPAQVLLGRVGIKVPKGKANFSILGGRVMKVTTTTEGVVVEEEVFNPNFDYSKAGEGVEYYILPRTGADIDYNNFYWSFASSSVSETFKLDINFFHKDESGLWQAFFADGQEKSINVIVKDGNNSVSLTAESVDLVINYDENGKPIPAELELSADIGNSIYSRVAYFLYDNTRDGAVDIKDVFNCADGVSYSKDYKGQNINISGVSPKESYMLYELYGNRLVVNKSYSGSVVVIAALVRTDVNGNLVPDPNDATKYQLVCFSGAKVVNVDSTLSISNMTPTFSFINGEPEKFNNQFYLPAINKNADGSTKDMISFTLKLSSEDVANDAEKLMAAYGKSLNVVCCDRDGNAYQEQYLTLGNFAELVDQRTPNMAIFQGTININEEFFTAGKNAVDQGRAISFKLVYDDGKEEREKLVGKDAAVEDGIVDYFYVYFQQPKTLKAEYQQLGDVSVSDVINVQISSGANGLTIDWGQKPLTGSSYAETINALNNLLTFTMLDQFGQEIKPTDGVYSVSFDEERKDSNKVLVFDEEVEGSLGIPAGIKDFKSTNGRVVETSLRVYVVDRKAGNEYVKAVNLDNTLSSEYMKSELIQFEISSEGLDYVKYDKTTDVGNTDDDGRFADAEKNETTIKVTKYVAEDDEITLSNLFKIYTTGNNNANLDYQIVFDGTWLQGFQGGTDGVDLKKMFQINDEAGSADEQKNITAYANMPITKLRFNAPFNPLRETVLKFKINSTNNLYSVTLELCLSSEIEVSRSFENYQSKYAKYLTESPTEAVSVFADESYNLDEYLVFNSSKFSWAKALIGKGLELGSKQDGVFYESQGIASLNTVVSGEIRLDIAPVRQYTTITIVLYYGVRSEYAFSTSVALYVNPNIVIEEKVSSLDENPLLDLTQIASENVSNYYSVWKATSYIRELDGGGARESVSLDGGTTYLSAKNLIYVRKDNNGFLSIQSGNDTEGGKFAFVDGKSIDVMNSYVQSFSIADSTNANLDAVKIKVDKDNEREVVKYSPSDRVAITFSVCYNAASVDELIGQVFPEATVIQYEGQTRLLILAGKTYSVAEGFAVRETTGSSIRRNASGQITPYNMPNFVDHENTVSVYSSVSDGKKNLEINITLGVTVSNIGNEFVYYTNNNGEFNVFADENGKSIVDFDKLISSNPNDLENEGVYETLVAGKSYKILHDIGTEYTRTTDTEIDLTKTYYQKGASSFVVVEKPSVEYISSYYEKNLPEPGFYYDSVLLAENLARRVFTVEVVSGANGYLNNLASYSEADKMLRINSMEAGLEGFILLKFTVSTVGANVSSYSWYYRIKVVPNFEIGKVNYPYNESASENYGEYLDINSTYYNPETLTYTIDLSEKFNTSNSGRVAGTRFDDIVWTNRPEGTITENYRASFVSSNAVNVAFDGRNISISYKTASDVGSAVTVTIEKYWCVDDVEVVGSAMAYTFKLNQARTYSTSLYRGDVKDSNKVGSDNQTSYDATIIAGSGEQVFIPVVRPVDGSVTGEIEKVGSYIKGDTLQLLDAFKFKKVWVAQGTEVSYKMPITEEVRSLILGSDEILVEENDWIYADVQEDLGRTSLKNVVVHFAEGSGKDDQTYRVEDGKLWFSININVGTTAVTVEAGVNLEDLIVEYLDTQLQEYFVTADKNRIASKTYYVVENGEYVVATFETEDGNEDADFKENTQYFEKYRIPYNTIVLNPKENISKDGTFELGVYTEEGVVFKVNLKAESYFEWTWGQKAVASGKHYTLKDLITTLSTKDKNREILEVSLALTNGSDGYSEDYYITEDDNRQFNKTYYIVKDGRFQVVDFGDGDGFVKGIDYYEKVTLNYADLIMLSGTAVPNSEGKLNLEGVKLEIAPLTEDISLEFNVTIKSAPKDNMADESFYTFAFTISAQKAFDESNKRFVQDVEWRYGQRAFSVVINNNETNAIVTPKVDETSTPTTLSLVSTANTTYRFIKDEGYALVDKGAINDDGVSELKITPEDVAEEQTSVQKTLKIIGMFRGKEISRFEVSYQYQIAKNVLIERNYPNPDGAKDNTSTAEYIYATNEVEVDELTCYATNEIEDFFNSHATFADKNGERFKNRIEVVSAVRNADTSYSPYVPKEGEMDIEKNWNVSVVPDSKIQVNYKKVVNGKEVSGSVDRESSDTEKQILTDSKDGKIDLSFTILGRNKIGTVTFNITINKVSISYTVSIVDNPIVKVTTNSADSYNGNREVIYAEDLAKSEEQTIFAESRLLNYTFKGSVVVGATYYARITNTENIAENKIVPITVQADGNGNVDTTNKNIDLGKSYKTFKYSATYRSLEGAQAGDSGDVVADSDIYIVAPSLTSRIVVKYYDDRLVKLDTENYIKLGTDLAWEADGTNYTPSSTLSGYVQSQAKVVGKDDTLAVLNGRTYVKADDGDAYAGYFSGVRGIDSDNPSKLYSGVILISKVGVNAAKVKLNTTTGSMSDDQVQKITLNVGNNNSEEWYVYKDTAKNYQEGVYTDASGVSNAIKLSGATWNDCVLELIKNTVYGYQKVEDIVLSTDDYKKEKRFEIAIQVGGEAGETILPNSQYVVFLEAEFAVSDNADSGTSYTTRTINAGDEVSLFDDIDFGVYNARTGNKYSTKGAANTDNMKDSGGSVDLRIYGLSGLAITQAGDSLTRAAYDIHRNLKSISNKDSSKEVVYKTGLTPRANGLSGQYNCVDEIDSYGVVESGSIDTNYITYSDIVDDVTGKKVDFSIRARGASNDGNHVMLRITYSVNFGNNTNAIVISHNLLLRVLPNSSVTFLTRDGSTASTASANEIVEWQSYASNKESAFEIQNNDKAKGNEANFFYLWKKDNKEGTLVDDFSKSAVQAKMYNNKEFNNANTFNFSYEYSGDYNAIYNSYNDKTIYSTDEPEIPPQIKFISSNEEYKVTLKELLLGDKTFYVDGVNEFGFRIRFYFKLSATEKPEVDSLTVNGESVNTLKEGQAVVVGAKYLPVAPAKIAVGEGDSQQWYQLLGTITYSHIGNDSSQNFADVVSNVPSQVGSIYLSAETNTAFGTVVKKIDKIQNNKFEIWGSESRKDDADWTFTNGSAAILVEKDQEHKYQNGDLGDKTIYFNRKNVFTLAGNGADSSNKDAAKQSASTKDKNNLDGARIAIYGYFTNGDDFGTFTNLVYEQAEADQSNKVIEQVYTADGESRTPTLSVQESGTNDSNKALVSLRGISAYAFPSNGEDSIKALNLDVAQRYKSRVNDIKVEEIRYYLNGKEIGVSKRGSETIQSSEGNVSLVTSGEYKFYNGKEYQDKYKLTNDRFKYAGKTYYVLKSGKYEVFKDNFEMVDVEGGQKIPKPNTYYEKYQEEKVVKEYVQTTDTAKVEGKTYYTYDPVNKEYVVDESSAFVANKGYYTRTNPTWGWLVGYKYSQTEDSSKVTGTTYYTFNIDTGKYVEFKGEAFVANYGYFEKAVTNESKSSPIDGIAYANDADFMVPVIDSIYFANGPTLNNVQMRITLVEGENKTVVYKDNISISRLEEPVKCNETVIDNNYVNVPDGKEVLNDTLEIVLDPGESVTFAISDKEFTEMPQVGQVTERNNEKYTVTKYIPISATIDKFREMENNFNSRQPYDKNATELPQRTDNNFIITVIDKTTTDGDIDFIYNGENISKTQNRLQKYDESRDVLIVDGKEYYYKSGDGYALYEGSFYNKVSRDETMPITGKRYYILDTINGVYTQVSAPIASEMSLYYEQNQDAFYYTVESYNETEAKNYAGKSFYEYKDYTYRLVEKPVNGQKYYVPKTYYEKAFALTQDTKVDSSKTYYKQTSNGVYTKVEKQDVKNEELSIYYETVESVVYETKEIQKYGKDEEGNNAEHKKIKLNINDISEISSLDSTTSRTLYFLYKGTQSNINSSGLRNDDMYYRMSQTFNVKPQYQTVTSDSVDTSNNIEFKIDSYIKAESSNDFYYVIPRAIWGAELKLNGQADHCLDSEDAYKFTYEINKEVSGGAGGAFIDEEGNIFTDKNFNLQESTITVNVYMKVSGQNGFFDKDTTKFRLCQFRMMLKPSTKSKNITWKDSNKSYELISNGLISKPSGYTFTKHWDSEEIEFTTGTIGAYDTSKKTFARKVGDVLDFTAMRETLGIKDYHYNVYYHVVEDVHNYNNVQTKTVLYYNNMGSYKIETAGTHTLTIVVGYRASNTSEKFNFETITVEIMAYNELDRTDMVKLIFASKYEKTKDTAIASEKTYYVLDADEQYVKVETPKVDDIKTYYELIQKETFSLGTGEWYTLAENGTISLITEKDANGNSLYTAPGKTGIHYQSFVAKDANGNTRTYSYQFYVVSSEEIDISKEIVLNQGATFNLSSLYKDGSKYKFYKVLGGLDNGSDHTSANSQIREITMESSFTEGANTSSIKEYIVRDENGKHFRIRVTYRFTTPSSDTTDSIFVERGDDLATAIKNAVEAKLRKDLNNNTVQVVTDANGKYSVKLIGDGEQLSYETGKAETEKATEIRIDGKRYLVVYQITESGRTETRYLRYSPTIYLYDGSSDITIKTTPNNDYTLMLAGAEILNKLGIADKKDVTIVSFSEFNTSGSLVPANTAVLGGLANADIKKEYLIQVTYKEQVEGEEKEITKNYLINLTFSNYSVVGAAKSVTIETTAQESYALSNCSAKLLEQLKDITNVSKVEFYKLSATTLISTTHTNLKELNDKDIAETYVIRIDYKKTVKEGDSEKVVDCTEYYRFNVTFTKKV